jgi:hypothetical protein
LRKCLLLAHQLKNDKLKAWAEYELNGYPDADSLPKYRVCRIVAKGAFYGPGGAALNDQPLAPASLEKDFRHWAETAHLTQPIASYDTGKDEHGAINGGSIEWPANLVAHVSDDFFPGWNMIRARQVLPGSLFAALMDTVRNRILQLALELKDELGGDISDVSKIPHGRVDQSVVNHIYSGNVVVAANAENFSQIQNTSVTQNDLPSLVSALNELGLLPGDVETLQTAITADATTGSATMGQKTAEWLKELPATLGKGTLKVGFEVAKALVTKYVLKFYGLGV